MSKKKINLKGDAKLTARTPADDAKAQLGKRLIHACHYNDLERVKALIAQGADPNYKNLWGETPAYAAAGSGGLEVLEYLATLGCNFEAKTSGSQTLLHNAVATGNAKVRPPESSGNVCLASEYRSRSLSRRRRRVPGARRPTMARRY